jgi:hypothetical protein
MTAAVTPLEALRRLHSIASTINYSDCVLDGAYNQLQGELAVAESVLRVATPPVAPVAAQPVVQVPVQVTDDMVVAFCETWYSKVRCIDDPEMQDAYAAMLYAAPHIEAQPAGEANRDAARWRQVLRYVGADRSPALMCSYFVLRGIHAVPGTDLMRGGVAGHFTEAIDAAMAQGDKQ